GPCRPRPDGSPAHATSNISSAPSMARGRRRRRQCNDGSAGARSAADDLAAVRVEHLAGHVRTLLTGEEEVAGRDLPGLADAAERLVLAELGDLLRIEARGDERRPDRPRRNAVD